MGLAGAGALSSALPVSKTFAQARAPMQLNYRTYENPKTWPRLHTRLKQERLARSSGGARVSDADVRRPTRAASPTLVFNRRLVRITT